MALQYRVMIPNSLIENTNVVRVTRDAESRFTPAGTRVTNISVVASRRYQVDGEWKDQPRYFTVTVWGDAAERAATIRKNNILAVSYSLADMEARPYTSKDGEQKAELKIGSLESTKPSGDDRSEYAMIASTFLKGYCDDICNRRRANQQAGANILRSALRSMRANPDL